MWKNAQYKIVLTDNGDRCEVMQRRWPWSQWEYEGTSFTNIEHAKVYVYGLLFS